MSIMQQSSKAQTRVLAGQFQHLNQKILTLSGFHAWDRNRVINGGQHGLCTIGATDEEGVA